MLLTKTPYRVSFFGGGTDYPDWYREHGGMVIATTINKYVRLSVRHLPPFFPHKHKVVYSKVETVSEVSEISHPAVRAVLTWMKWQTGLDLHYDGDLPARSGMGSSSAFTVGLIHCLHALQGKMIPKRALAKASIHIEQEVLKENVGCQDQVCASYGGFNCIEFHKDGGFSVSPIVAEPTRLAQLESSLTLVFTSMFRNSSEVAGVQLQGLAKKTSTMHRMREFVDEAIQILSSPTTPISDFGKLLHESWALKKSLSPLVSNEKIDRIYDDAMRAGAVGGKVLGAGGGGFMLCFVPPERMLQFRGKLKGLIHVPIRFESLGSHVAIYQPDDLELAA